MSNDLKQRIERWLGQWMEEGAPMPNGLDAMALLREAADNLPDPPAPTNITEDPKTWKPWIWYTDLDGNEHTMAGSTPAYEGHLHTHKIQMLPWHATPDSECPCDPRQAVWVQWDYDCAPSIARAGHLDWGWTEEGNIKWWAKVELEYFGKEVE